MKTRIVAWGCLLWLLTAPPAWAQRSQPKGAEAQKLYETAMSLMKTGQAKQTADLLDQFIDKYPSNENVPFAYMQVASCRLKTGDKEGYAKAVDEAIKKFPDSAVWFRSCAVKLKAALAAGQREQYVALVEEMAKTVKVLPFDLNASLPGSLWELQRSEYALNAPLPRGFLNENMVEAPGWIMDLVAMANSPELAARALKALGLENRPGSKSRQLPPDWQLAHVLLLRQADKAAEADAQFKTYSEEWGREPLGMSFWLLAAAIDRKEEKSESVDAIWKHIIETYGGSQSLSTETYRGIVSYGGLEDNSSPLFSRMSTLAQEGRYDEFKALATYFLNTYGKTVFPSGTLGLWVRLATPQGADKKDFSRIEDAMKVLDGAATLGQPGREYQVLRWKIDLNLRRGNIDDAAKLAAPLVSEKFWSAGSYELLRSLAEKNEAFKPLLQQARQKWNIPEASKDPQPAKMLAELTAHLKDDEVRHVEELMPQMTEQYPSAAETIQALHDVIAYYTKKVLREPRDKWAGAMIKAYPYHPLTEDVLQMQVKYLAGENKAPELAMASDTLRERFPSSQNLSWYSSQLAQLKADDNARREFLRKIFGPLAEAGEVSAINEIAALETAAFTTKNPEVPDFKKVGDYWVSLAEKFPDSRTGLHCLMQAMSAYYYTPAGGYFQNRKVKPLTDDAVKIVQTLRAQKLDPELAWKMEFADINMQARWGDAAKAASLLEERLKGVKKIRDLSLRLDIPTLGAGLVKADKGQLAVTLGQKLKGVCFTARDADALEMMQAQMCETAGEDALAAQHYWKIVNNCAWPALRYGFFNAALEHMRKAGDKGLPAAVQSYVKTIKTAQDLVPGLYASLGQYYVQSQPAAAAQIRALLLREYPDSAALMALDKAVAAIKEK